MKKPSNFESVPQTPFVEKNDKFYRKQKLQEMNFNQKLRRISTDTHMDINSHSKLYKTEFYEKKKLLIEEHLEKCLPKPVM